MHGDGRVRADAATVPATELTEAGATAAGDDGENRPGTQHQHPKHLAPQAQQAPKAPQAAATDGAPNEAMLGAPIYPSAVFLTSYDAGPRAALLHLRQHRYVRRSSSTYYKTVLKQKGDEPFEAPPTHQFETDEIPR